jgi:hypothetical protein
MSDKKYKWGSPHVWLTDCLMRGRWTPSEVTGVAINLTSILDGDEIQDLFQNEMDESGYFNPIETVEAQDG